MPRVSDYSALLYYLDGDHFRWNAPAEIGTQAIITYSFTETGSLADPAASDPYGATEYWSFDEDQRDIFREGLSLYEDISGVRFIEVEGRGMINAFGTTGSSAGGWANIAMSGNGFTGRGDLTVDTDVMTKGTYGYVTVLHEIGHTLGLQHSHDGGLTLDHHADTPENTVMTYNHSPAYVTELGTFDIQAMQHLYGNSDSFTGWEILGGGSDPIIIRSTDASETVIGTDQNTTINAKGGHDHVQGREADDTLRGADGRDTMVGGLGEDRLFGGNGADLLIGGTGGDAYSGGSDDDVLYGNRGHDMLHGGSGNDHLLGGIGRDTLVGGDGSDTLTGGTGADTFVFDQADAFDTNRITDFGRGADVIDLSGLWLTSMDQLDIAKDSGTTTISYSNWFELELTNYADPLTGSDLIFS
ncbi:metallopeptidase [Phaeobacter inhibens]|uniref:matrixin family metalloprotease n=1 Tax=Phaeobacter inhibens TaxID=221822 RepID=UPI0021A3E1A5|nr:matrixin family metalloprotease [Phaeobacter inhibens]UWR45182.1 metallopeptidase [Phaeobacter inhibens]UWR80340.1 metallopeptidase [Phaeobacter inhibens]